MTFRKQLQWGGLLIIVVSLLLSISNIIVYAGKHNAAIQAVYGVGYTGLILACTIIHIVQSRRAGLFGLFAYLVSVLCLVYVNVATFLTLADLAGIEGTEQALTAVWSPMIPAVYAIFVGLILLGLAVAYAGVLPRSSGILMALGMGLQLPAQFAIDLAGPMFFIFTIGGSVIFGIGLIWIGWTLWSNKELLDEDPRLSNLDRMWGSPLVMFSALLLIADAWLNSIANLTLFDSIIHLLSIATLILAIVILYTAQADRAGTMGLAGFFFLHLGATLNFIPAYFIMAQLAGQLDSNQALMASWIDIPVGRYGSYMLFLGILLFGVASIRAEVFPRWSGWLIVIGLGLLLPSQFQSQAYLFSTFWIIGATLLGVGIGWMGWILFRNRDTQQAA